MTVLKGREVHKNEFLFQHIVDKKQHLNPTEKLLLSIKRVNLRALLSIFRKQKPKQSRFYTERFTVLVFITFGYIFYNKKTRKENLCYLASTPNLFGVRCLPTVEVSTTKHLQYCPLLSYSILSFCHLSSTLRQRCIFYTTTPY